MLNRLFMIAVAVPIAIVLIALAVANRAWVPFTLDPFNPGNAALTIQLPLFAFLFAALAIGMILGSLATWLKQGHYRRLARQKAAEADSLRAANMKPPIAAASALPKPTA